MLDKINAALKQLRQTKPLVLCLTNYVTMDFMANSLLALGASPIMSCAVDEIEDLVKIAQAVNINIGTLNAEFIERCEVAIKFAQHYNKPVILDPVGAGASLLRTTSARKLMVFADIIRGNASEIVALAEDKFNTHGVDSTQQVQNAKAMAFNLAKALGCTVVVSGEEDFITDGARQELLKFGSPLMSRITGMGCALTAVIAAFRAVIDDAFDAAAIATAYFGLCGELAHAKTNQPGTFRAAFIDALYSGSSPDRSPHLFKKDVMLLIALTGALFAEGGVILRKNIHVCECTSLMHTPHKITSPSAPAPTIDQCNTMFIRNQRIVCTRDVIVLGLCETWTSSTERTWTYLKRPQNDYVERYIKMR